MFSNGTDAQIWQGRNCHKCWKYDGEGTGREKMRCRAAYDIDIGYITGELSRRVDRITEKPDCPYRQEKRPAYGKLSGAMPLFEEGNHA